MTVLVLDVAVFPVFSFEPTMIAEIEQGIHIIVNDKDDVRAPAAVAAGGAALGDKLFPAKRRLPVAAISRFHRDGRPIDKLHKNPRIQEYLRPKTQVRLKHRLRLCFRFFLCVDADLAPVTAPALESDLARNLREQRIILANTYIMPRMKMRPALTNENTARRHHRIRLRLHTQTLRRAVAAVTCATDALFMCEKL